MAEAPVPVRRGRPRRAGRQPLVKRVNLFIYEQRCSLVPTNAPRFSDYKPELLKKERPDWWLQLYKHKTTMIDEELITSGSGVARYKKLQDLIRFKIGTHACPWTDDYHIYDIACVPMIKDVTLNPPSLCSIIQAKTGVDEYSIIVEVPQTTLKNESTLKNEPLLNAYAASSQGYTDMYDYRKSQVRPDSFPDFEFRISGPEGISPSYRIKVHKCVMFSKSTYFKNLFVDETDGADILLPRGTSMIAFVFMIEYFYGYGLSDFSGLKTTKYMNMLLILGDYYDAAAFMNATIEHVIKLGHEYDLDLLRTFRRLATVHQWNKLVGAHHLDSGILLDTPPRSRKRLPSPDSLSYDRYFPCLRINDLPGLPDKEDDMFVNDQVYVDVPRALPVAIDIPPALPDANVDQDDI